MINKFLDHLEEWLIGTFMAVATLVIFVSVLHRYASGVPALFKLTQQINLVWAQELCIYLFIWMAKFGAAYGVRTGIHVGVDVLINRLKGGKRKFWITFGLLAGALFTAIVASLGAKFVWAIYFAGQVSPDLELPMWIVYLAIPLGSSLMCFRFLQVAWQFHKTGALPKHDVTRVEGMEQVTVPGKGA